MYTILKAGNLSFPLCHVICIYVSFTWRNDTILTAANIMGLTAAKISFLTKTDNRQYPEDIFTVPVVMMVQQRITCVKKNGTL